MSLSHLSSQAQNSRGRVYPEQISLTRNCFTRDLDRVIHCTAFRRLKGKTQVFVANGDDYFRTRLTHSLEVAQIARSLARNLGLEVDLAQTIALSHDLGHPPFGHAGEDALSDCMIPYGGFDHNVQTFRILTTLEERYPAFLGLNLSLETLEGIVKHNGPITHKRDIASWHDVFEFDAAHNLNCTHYASLEAQAAALADDIAYNNHDIDDGLRAGLFSISDLIDIPIIGPAIKAVKKDWPECDDRMIRLEAIRRCIGVMLEDVLRETNRKVTSLKISTLDEVGTCQSEIVSFSLEMSQDLQKLRNFLYERLYMHPSINRTRSVAKRIVRKLFELYVEEPEIMPQSWYESYVRIENPLRRIRLACDYLAGMTDSYALGEYRRLFNAEGF